jgi:hypothetical protein
VENEEKGRGRYLIYGMVWYEMSVKNTGYKYIGCPKTWRFLVCAEYLNLVNCAVFHLFSVSAYTHTQTQTDRCTHTNIFSV